MDDLRDDELLALVASRPEAFGVFHRRHERAVVRFFMERLRSPEPSADLAAETFAEALLDAARFDRSRGSPAAWLLALADKQLLRASRTGMVDDHARRALRIPAQPLDDRALERVWQLRGDARPTMPKPRCSGSVILASPDGGPVRAAEGAFEDALVEAARRRRRRRRRRGQLSIGARVALGLVTVVWFTAYALAPDRSPSAANATRWLPFAAPHARLEGSLPTTWHLESSPRTPAPDLLMLTTFPTGDPSGRRCANLPTAEIGTMGETDALLLLQERDRGTFRKRPERLTAERSRSVERVLRQCLPGQSPVRASRTRFADGDRRLEALIVVGPAAGAGVEVLALEILNRVRATPA